MVPPAGRTSAAVASLADAWIETKRSAGTEVKMRRVPRGRVD